jgi:hypothetical protein
VFLRNLCEVQLKDCNLNTEENKCDFSVPVDSRERNNMTQTQMRKQSNFKENVIPMEEKYSLHTEKNKR